LRGRLLQVADGDPLGGGGLEVRQQGVADDNLASAQLERASRKRCSPKCDPPGRERPGPIQRDFVGGLARGPRQFGADVLDRSCEFGRVPFGPPPVGGQRQ